MGLGRSQTSKAAHDKARPHPLSQIGRHEEANKKARRAGQKKRLGHDRYLKRYLGGSFEVIDALLRIPFR